MKWQVWRGRIRWRESAFCKVCESWFNTRKICRNSFSTFRNLLLQRCCSAGTVRMSTGCGSWVRYGRGGMSSWLGSTDSSVLWTSCMEITPEDPRSPNVYLFDASFTKAWRGDYKLWFWCWSILNQWVRRRRWLK